VIINLPPVRPKDCLWHVGTKGGNIEMNSNRPELKEKRRRLRNNPTKAESVLWSYFKEQAN